MELSGGKESAELSLNIGINYISLGDYERAGEYLDNALELQVGCLGILNHSWMLILQQKFDKARIFIDSICVTSKCREHCQRCWFYLSVFEQDYRNAELSFNPLIESIGLPSKLDSLNIAFVYTRVERNNEAQIILNKLKESVESRVSDDNTWHGIDYIILSSVYALMDENEAALKYLSKAEKLGFINGWHDMIEFYPPLENLWNDPEFKAIVRRAQQDKEQIREEVARLEERGELTL